MVVVVVVMVMAMAMPSGQCQTPAALSVASGYLLQVGDGQARGEDTEVPSTCADIWMPAVAGQISL